MADNEFLGNVGGRTLSKPPTPTDIWFDKSFRFMTRAFTWATIFLLAFIVYKIGGKALPSFPDLGFKFLFTSTWDSGEDLYGILSTDLGNDLQFIPGIDPWWLLR